MSAEMHQAVLHLGRARTEVCFEKVDQVKCDAVKADIENFTAMKHQLCDGHPNRTLCTFTERQENATTHVMVNLTVETECVPHLCVDLVEKHKQSVEAEFCKS